MGNKEKRPEAEQSLNILHRDISSVTHLLEILLEVLDGFDLVTSQGGR